MSTKQPNFILKKSLKDTLRAMDVGDVIRIKNKDFKYNSIRTVMYQLREEGIEITVSQKGLIDETQVTRLK